MIAADQITAWAGAGESETLELKRSTGRRREAAQTLCAMLNHRGGRVLFGVETPQETPQKTPQETPQKTPDAILELLKQQPELTFSQMAPLLGKSESAVKRAVRKLRESGRLQRVGPDKGGYWKVTE